MPKVYLSGYLDCHWPHAAFGEPTFDRDVLQNEPDNISLILVPGGADIHPDIYGHKRNDKTSCSAAADEQDLEAIDFALEHGIPIAGICRGGQVLIAKAGGFLYQHVSNHAGRNHMVRTWDDIEFKVTSAHHQMFGWPLPPKSELVVWATPHLSDCYESEETGVSVGQPLYEPECVWIPEMGALATQWHPEWMYDADSPGTRYYQFLLEKYLRPLAAKRFKSMK